MLEAMDENDVSDFNTVSSDRLCERIALVAPYVEPMFPGIHMFIYRVYILMYCHTVLSV